MSYRNARLANGFLSLDQLAGEIDLVKSRTVSDRGAGVERMVGDVDRRPGDAEREDREWRENLRRKFHAAETKLRRLRLGYLVPTLALICKNGKNREESIREIASRRHLGWEAAKARYFAHREKIEKIFLDQ